jgi:hypothetical protein
VPAPNPNSGRSFYYAPITRDLWLRICSHARRWECSTDEVSERVVERGLDLFESHEAAALHRSNALWKARFKLMRERPLPPA